MTYKTLELTVFNELKFKNGDLEITEEQLFDAYDFIIITVDKCYTDDIKHILEKLNYHYVYDYHIDINWIKKKCCYANNKFIKYELIPVFGFGYDIPGTNNNERWKYYQDKLPCFILSKDCSELNYLSNFYKISKICGSNYFLLMEQKGNMTKPAKRV